MGGVWAADHRPIGGGAFTLLHHLYPQGEQHGGVQEDQLGLDLYTHHPRSCTWHQQLPLRENFTLSLPCPTSLSLSIVMYTECSVFPCFFFSILFQKDMAAACSGYTGVNISHKQYLSIRICVFSILSILLLSPILSNCQPLFYQLVLYMSNFYEMS